MINVTYPEASFKTKEEKGKPFIFDVLRKQWLAVTDEEWVRQNFIQYLIQVLNYPAAFIALEKKIMLGELVKRFDVLIYNQDHKPWMMIECKAQSVPLSDAVLQQALRYNISVPVSFIVITNGRSTYAWKKSSGRLILIEEMPEWGKI